MTDAAVLRLAATCIPIRERGSTGLEMLMVRRNPDLSFGGFWTFPGGVLEAADGAVPDEIDEEVQNWGEPALLATAAAGAVRETIEETALQCDLSSLAWFSHWIPPRMAPKRFATWFFLAPEHSGDLVVDESENEEARWISPEAALAESAEARFPLAVPTWITIDDISQFNTVAQLMDRTVTQGARLHHTRAMMVDGARVLCWAGDASYETGVADTDGPRNRAIADSTMQILERIRS